MNAKIYLPGLAAGILASLLLWIPLAVYLRSILLADGPRANAWLAWGLGFLVVITLCVAGAAAARLSGASSRSGAAFCGAISGLVAALLVYILVGGAAAGAWGARPLLDFGLQRASGDAESTQLLLNSLTGVHWWTALALWASLLSGIVFGAFGGFLTDPAGTPDPEITLIYQVVAVSGVLTAGLGLVTSTALLMPLLQSVSEAIARLDLTPAYPLDTLLIFPVVTLFLMMLAS